MKIVLKLKEVNKYNKEGNVW